jgi:hypothetical protein
MIETRNFTRIYMYNAVTLVESTTHQGGSQLKSQQRSAFNGIQIYHS